MKKLRAVLIGLLFYAPFGASAALPAIVIALIAGAALTAGFSIYRSVVPVNLGEGLEYFSSCWSCDLFSKILSGLSTMMPRIYEAVGVGVIPIAAALTLVWFAWRILSDYINVKSETNAWQYVGDFGTHLVKLAFVAALLAFPLPRFIADTFVTPIMSVGLSYNHIATNYADPEDTGFETCMIATALSEPPDDTGIYGPKLRHNLSCQVAEFHRMTGLGMTVGWTFAQMAFSYEYMYKAGPVPIFPNVMLIFAGLTILAMFLWALFPVPLYFLEVFIKLSMDLVMLPLMLLGWLFSGWKVFPAGGKGIKAIIEDVVKSTCGIALVGLFVGFAVLFLGAVVGEMDGINALMDAIKRNDSKFLMDSLMMHNDSIVNIILVGIFTGMFMNGIPALTNKLFQTDEFRNAKAWQDNIAKVMKNVYDGIKGKIKAALAKPTPANGGGADSGGSAPTPPAGIS